MTATALLQAFFMASTPGTGDGGWPVFEVAATPDIALGSGTHENKDINNPNLWWDAPNSRWIMQYTGYGSLTGGGNQVSCLAYATSLEGPWTKDPQNPVIVDKSAGFASMNGGFAYFGGRWITTSNAFGTTIWFYESQDLHTWTRMPAAFPGADGFLRVTQDGGTLELYYRRGYEVSRRVSKDGVGWSEPVQIVGAAPIPAANRNGGEVSVWVPPGGEGKRMLLAMDYFPGGSLSAGRGILAAATADGGVTWKWREHFRDSSKVAGQWDGYATFDSFLAHENGRLYVYSAGTVSADTGVLDMGIQIGHASAPFDPDWLFT